MDVHVRSAHDVGTSSSQPPILAPDHDGEKLPSASYLTEPGSLDGAIPPASDLPSTPTVGRDTRRVVDTSSTALDTSDVLGQSQDLLSSHSALSVDKGHDGTASDSDSPSIIPDLPPVQQPSEPAFSWGETLPGEAVIQSLQKAYNEAVHWLPNIFTIPLGAVGKRFVDEATRLLRGFAEDSALESVSFLALMVMPQLLLQKPADPSSHRLRISCLERRLNSWAAGHFDELLVECRALQDYLRRRRGRSNSNKTIMIRMLRGHVSLLVLCYRGK